MGTSQTHHRSYGIIKSFEARALKKRRWVSKIADYLTSFFGSLVFFVFNIAIFTFWLLANSGKIPGISVFDPFPFVLLITFVSLEAIILSTIVLISQNRENTINSLREELLLQVNLISEKEITKILQLQKKILDKLDVKVKDEELTDMLKELDESYVERKLESQMFPKPIAKNIINPLKKVEKELKRK